MALDLQLMKKRSETLIPKSDNFNSRVFSGHYWSEWVWTSRDFQKHILPLVTHFKSMPAVYVTSYDLEADGVSDTEIFNHLAAGDWFSVDEACYVFYTLISRQRGAEPGFLKAHGMSENVLFVQQPPSQFFTIIGHWCDNWHLRAFPLGGARFNKGGTVIVRS